MLLTLVRLWSIGNFSPFSNLCSSCSFPHVWGQTPGLQKEALCWADQFSLPWQPEHALVWCPAPRIWGCGTHDAPSWWFLQRPNVPAPSSWQPRKHAQQWHEQRWENTQLSEPFSLINLVFTAQDVVCNLSDEGYVKGKKLYWSLKTTSFTVFSWWRMGTQEIAIHWVISTLC